MRYGSVRLEEFSSDCVSESLLANIITVVEMLIVGSRDSNKTGLVLVILELLLDTETTEGPVGLLM